MMQKYYKPFINLRASRASRPDSVPDGSRVVRFVHNRDAGEQVLDFCQALAE